MGIWKRIGSFLGLVSLASSLLGLAALVLAGVLYAVTPEYSFTSLSLAALGGLFLIIALLGSLGRVRKALLGRRGRFGANTAVMVGAFLGLVVIANFLGFRYPQRVDTTATRQFTVAPQTVKILEELKQPVTAVAFFVTGDPVLPQAENLLREYKFRSPLFSYRVVDPDAEPSMAQQYNITQYQTVVFESGGKRQPVTSIGEQEYTSAILKVTGMRQKKVYFLTGHDERDIFSEADEGMGYALQSLLWDNYQLDTLNLATKPEIPADAAVIVIAGPRKDLLGGSEVDEGKLLTDYLRKGGALFLLADSKHPAQLDDLLASWGLALGKGMIMDTESFAYPDIGTPAIQRQQYIFNQVTKVLDTTFFPEATSLELSDKLQKSKTVSVTPLAFTTDQSWLETDLSNVSRDKVKYDEGADKKGPLLIGAMVEAVGLLGEEPPATPPAKKTRLVVIGDSDFASNKFFYSLGNSDLFLNSVNWLAEEEALISIRPKPYPFRWLVVNQRQWNWIKYSSWFLLPALVVVVGVFIWWRRR